MSTKPQFIIRHPVVKIRDVLDGKVKTSSKKIIEQVITGHAQLAYCIYDPRKMCNDCMDCAFDPTARFS